MNFKFSLGDSVKIPSFDKVGKVIGIYIDFEGVQYQVRFYHDFGSKSVYFSEEDLRLEKEAETSFGFAK